MKKYIFIGKDLDLPEFFFSKGTIYYGQKIEALLEKYPLLDIVLVNTDTYSAQDNNIGYLNSIVDQIKGGVK